MFRFRSKLEWKPKFGFGHENLFRSVTSFKEKHKTAFLHLQLVPGEIWPSKSHNTDLSSSIPVLEKKKVNSEKIWPLMRFIIVCNQLCIRVQNLKKKKSICGVQNFKRNIKRTFLSQELQKTELPTRLKNKIENNST